MSAKPIHSGLVVVTQKIYLCNVGGNAKECMYGDDADCNGICDHLGGNDIDEPLCKCEAAIEEARR